MSEKFEHDLQNFKKGETDFQPVMPCRTFQVWPTTCCYQRSPLPRFREAAHYAFSSQGCFPGEGVSVAPGPTLSPGEPRGISCALTGQWE